MTSEEKESFCRTLAFLFSPPDQEWANQAGGGLFHSFFYPYLIAWEEDLNVLKGFLWEGEAEVFLDDMRREYERLFSEVNGEGISLMESFYKPWTLDLRCTLPFASDKGLMMGDSALHLLALYERCGLEASEAFSGRPDHLVLELDFLAHLYQRATDSEIKQYIGDHLDWTSALREEVRRFAPGPFFESALAVLSLFLQHERARLEGEDDGKKDIH
jgi:TorA maturation chaperone TorD